MNGLHRKHIKKYPISRVTIPFDGATVMTDRWWVVEDERVLFWGHSPQCNSIESIARYIQKRLYPEAEVRFIPAVYREPQYD